MRARCISGVFIGGNDGLMISTRFVVAGDFTNE
jgi:hypothetical protein